MAPFATGLGCVDSTSLAWCGALDMQLACDTRVDSFLLRLYPFLGERLGPAQLVTL